MKICGFGACALKEDGVRCLDFQSLPPSLLVTQQDTLKAQGCGNVFCLVSEIIITSSHKIVGLASGFRI